MTNDMSADFDTDFDAKSRGNCWILTDGAAGNVKQARVLASKHIGKHPVVSRRTDPQYALYGGAISKIATRVSARKSMYQRITPHTV